MERTRLAASFALRAFVTVTGTAFVPSVHTLLNLFHITITPVSMAVPERHTSSARMLIFKQMRNNTQSTTRSALLRIQSLIPKRHPAKSAQETNIGPTVSICQLPAELVFQILQGLEHASALCLLKTCRTMRSVVETHLYTSLQLDYSRRNRITKLVRTLCERPDLAKVVSSFNGHLVPFWPEAIGATGPHDLRPAATNHSRLTKEKWRGQKLQAVQKEYEEMLAMALRSMTSLRTLCSSDFGGGTWRGCFTMIRNTISPHVKLTTLQIHSSYYTRGSHLAADRTIVADAIWEFLQQQPSIETLALPAACLPLGLQPQVMDLPRLHALIAGPDDARKLVPGRPVETFRLLTLPEYEISETWADLTAGSVPLKSVTVNLALIAVGPYLPNLAVMASKLQGVSELRLTHLSDGSYDTVSCDCLLLLAVAEFRSRPDRNIPSRNGVYSSHHSGRHAIHQFILNTGESGISLELPATVMQERCSRPNACASSAVHSLSRRRLVVETV